MSVLCTGGPGVSTATLSGVIAGDLQRPDLTAREGGTITGEPGGQSAQSEAPVGIVVEVRLVWYKLSYLHGECATFIFIIRIVEVN